MTESVSTAEKNSSHKRKAQSTASTDVQTLQTKPERRPHIKGVYDRRTVYPNLFLFITARASSGKGRLNLCRHLVEPIHDRLKEINEAEVMDYKHRLAEYNAAGK